MHSLRTPYFDTPLTMWGAHLCIMLCRLSQYFAPGSFLLNPSLLLPLDMHQKELHNVHNCAHRSTSSHTHVCIPASTQPPSPPSASEEHPPFSLPSPHVNVCQRLETTLICLLTSSFQANHPSQGKRTCFRYPQLADLVSAAAFTFCSLPVPLPHKPSTPVLGTFPNPSTCLVIYQAYLSSTRSSYAAF